MIRKHSHFLAAFTVLLAGIGSAHPAMAQTTLFTTGFEASEGYSTTEVRTLAYRDSATGNINNFTGAAGSIFNKRSADGGYEWQLSRLGAESSTEGPVKAANNAIISGAAAASGSQSLRLDGAGLGSQSVRYATYLDLVAATTGVITVSADIRVDNPSAAYGQWGINLLTETGAPLLTSTVAFASVAGRVLASTDGSDLYAAINLSTGAALTSTYGAFSNYAVQLNYGSRTISGFVNGAQVGFVPINAAGTPTGGLRLNLGFAPNTPNNLTFLSLGQFVNSGSSESAYFDNFRISGSNVVVVPEASTLTLALPALGMIAGGIRIARRRRK